MCRSMVDIQCAAAEIRRGKKIDRKIERNHRMAIKWSALFHRATIIRHTLVVTYDTVYIYYAIAHSHIGKCMTMTEIKHRKFFKLLD